MVGFPIGSFCLASPFLGGGRVLVHIMVMVGFSGSTNGGFIFWLRFLKLYVSLPLTAGYTTVTLNSRRFAIAKTFHMDAY